MRHINVNRNDALSNKDTLSRLIPIFIILPILFTPFIYYKKDFIDPKYLFIHIVTGIISVLFIALNGYKNFKNTVFIPSTTLPIILFVLWSAISLLWTINIYDGIIFLTNNISFLVLFIIISNWINGEKQIEYLLDISCFIALIVSCYGLMQYYRIVPLPMEFYGERDPYSTFGRTNSVAHYLILLLPWMLVSVCVKCSWYLKILRSLIAIIVLYYFTVIKVRAAAIGFVFSLLLLTVILIKINYKVKIAVGVFIALLATSVFLKTKSISFTLDEPSVVFRYETWKSAFNIIKDKPIKGVGIGNVKAAFPAYWIPSLAKKQHAENTTIYYVHNEYLHLTAELGFTGFILFLICLISFGFTINKIINNKGNKFIYASIFAGISGWLVQSFFCFNFHTPASVLYLTLFAGIVGAGENISNKNIRSYAIGLKSKAMLIFFTVAVYIGLVRYSYRYVFSNDYFSQGAAMNSIGYFKNGIELFNKSIELYPYNEMSYYQRGEAFIGLKEYEKGLSDFKKDISLFPTSGIAHSRAGDLYDVMDRNEEALSEYTLALKYNIGMEKDIYIKRAAIFLKMKDYEKAIEEVSTILRIEDNLEDAWNIAGLSYFSLGKYELAAEHFSNAIAINPDMLAAYNNLAAAYISLKLYKDAENILILGIQKDQNFPEFWDNLALLHATMAHENESIENLP